MQIEYRNKVVQKLIEDADTGWNFIMVGTEYSNFFENFEIFSTDEKYRIINKVGSDIAVVIEKYLKAIYLADSKKAKLPDELKMFIENSIIQDDNDTRVGENKVTDEDIVDLLTNNRNPRTTYLTNKLNNSQKKQLKSLSFMGISHDFSKIFDNTMLSNEIMTALNNFFFYKESVFHEWDEEVEKMKDIINKDEVKDSFPKGRYSSISNFQSDLISLFVLVNTIQDVIRNEYGGVTFSKINPKFTVKFTNFAQGKKIGAMTFSQINRIYPDINSEIEIVEPSKGNQSYKKRNLTYGEIYNIELYELADFQHSKKSKEDNELKVDYSSINEKLSELLKNRKKYLGLYDKDNKFSKYIHELNMSESRLDNIGNGAILTYIENGERKYIAFKNGEVLKVSEEYANKIKREYGYDIEQNNSNKQEFRPTNEDFEQTLSLECIVSRKDDINPSDLTEELYQEQKDK